MFRVLSYLLVTGFVKRLSPNLCFWQRHDSPKTPTDRLDCFCFTWNDQLFSQPFDIMHNIKYNNVGFFYASHFLWPHFITDEILCVRFARSLIRFFFYYKSIHVNCTAPLHAFVLYAHSLGRFTIAFIHQIRIIQSIKITTLFHCFFFF